MSGLSLDVIDYLLLAFRTLIWGFVVIAVIAIGHSLVEWMRR